jgi:hypothetical protein
MTTITIYNLTNTEIRGYRAKKYNYRLVGSTFTQDCVQRGDKSFVIKSSVNATIDNNCVACPTNCTSCD